MKKIRLASEKKRKITRKFCQQVPQYDAKKFFEPKTEAVKGTSKKVLGWSKINSTAKNALNETDVTVKTSENKKKCGRIDAGSMKFQANLKKRGKSHVAFYNDPHFHIWTDVIANGKNLNSLV